MTTKSATENKLKTESRLSNIEIVPLSNDSKRCLLTPSTDKICYIGLLFDDDINDVKNYLHRLDNVEATLLELELSFEKVCSRLLKFESKHDEVCVRALIERARDYFWEIYGGAYIENYKNIDNGDMLRKYNVFDDTTSVVKTVYAPLSWKHFINSIDLSILDEQSTWALLFLRNEGRDYISEISEHIHEKSEGEIINAVKRMNNGTFKKLLMFMFPHAVAEL